MNRLPRRYNINAPRNDVGFTLVELLIVMTIVVILAVIAVSIFNSAGVLNKARDAQRKKDLSRIKIAFEEFYNDKSCYPSQDFAAILNSVSSCQSKVFSQWLSIWPCDPNKTPYTVIVEGACPKSYKVVTILENKKDSALDINQGAVYPITIGSGVTLNPAHYGVTSSNVSLFEKYENPLCKRGGCYTVTDAHIDPNSWNGTTNGCVNNFYTKCATGWPIDECIADCCGVGCQ